MSNFSQFKPAERSLSDVQAVQAPVQREVAPSQLSAFVEGVQDLGNAALTGYKIGQEQQASNLKLSQEEALFKQQGEFENELLRAKGLADQHGSQSVMFNTFLTKAFDQSVLDFDTKSKMLKDFQSTVLGKSFTTLSPEEKAFQAVTEEAGKAGFFLEGANPQEVEEGTAEYVKFEKKLAADAAELSSLNLKKSKIGLTQLERDEATKQVELKQFEAISNLAVNFRSTVKNSVAQVVEQYTKGTIDRATAEQTLLAKRGDLNAQIATVSRGMAPTQVEPISKPLVELYDRAIANLDSSNLLKEVENGNKLMIAQTTRNQMLANPKLVELSSISSLSGHNNPAIAALMTQETASILGRNSEKDGKVADITEESEGTGNYRTLITEGIANQTVLDDKGAPVTNPEELLTNVGNALKGGARFFDGDDLPEQNKAFLEWIAQPDIGGYIKENFNQLPASARQKLSDALITNATNFVYPATQTAIDSVIFTPEVIPAKESRSGRSKVSTKEGVTKPKSIRSGRSRSSQATLDDVEMIDSGDRLLFRATTAEGKGAAEKLNREVGGALTTYFNAIANTSGDSFSEVYNRERGVLWPSKYGEVAGETPEEAQADVQPEFQEGKKYVDENGDIWLYNGTDFEARGSSDGD